MTKDGRVSWWEFCVFTRLYQPWERILNTWRLLTKGHPGYQAWMTYEEVQQLLQPLAHKPGSYCFRLSVTRPGLWAIGFVNPFGVILQALPTTKSLYQALIDGAADGSYKYPLGQEQNIDPREHTPVTARVVVTAEQHQIYAEMDSQFELCKICHTNMKNLRIDPCGHLVCRSCFDEWNKQRAHGSITKCMFCRGEIRDTVNVAVENRFGVVAGASGTSNNSSDPCAVWRGAIGHDSIGARMTLSSGNAIAVMGALKGALLAGDSACIKVLFVAQGPVESVSDRQRSCDSVAA
eukprot:m.838590 g.838590  ORF g.838590 m.838590 type:complete len:293 (-) comp23462_c0_seq32:358-1236(-)